MAATLILGCAFFSMAVLGISLGVIFKKRTPLKGHCHQPVDGSEGCASCGDSPKECVSDDLLKKKLHLADYAIQSATSKLDLHK